MTPFVNTVWATDRDIVLETVKPPDPDNRHDYRQGLHQANFPPQYLDDKEIVLTAMGTAPHSFLRASVRLRSDRQVVMAALKSLNGNANVYDTSTTSNDVVREAFEGLTRLNLAFVGESLRADEDVVRAALRRRPTKLLSDEGSACCSCWSALGRGLGLLLGSKKPTPPPDCFWNPGALRFASAEIRDNRDIVSAVARSDGSPVCLAVHASLISDRLRDDAEIMLSFLRSDCDSWHSDWWSFSESADRSLPAKVLQRASSRLLDDEKFVRAALEFDKAGDMLWSVSDRLRGKRDIVEGRVREHPRALRYASDQLQVDPKLKQLARDELRKRSAEGCGGGGSNDDE